MASQVSRIAASVEGLQKLRHEKERTRTLDGKKWTYKRIADKISAERGYISEDTVERFFQGERVYRDNAAVIAEVFGLTLIEVCGSQSLPKPELSIDFNWQKICRDVLELQQKQWLTSHPLGAADRRVQDVYVPLGLVERQSKPRVKQDFEPENWSVQEQEEKIVPVSHQEFFGSTLKGQSPKSKGKRIAIVGEPGAGKTTLLQQIGATVDGVPIWIDLASLKRDDTLENYLLRWLDSTLNVFLGYTLDSTKLKQTFTELFAQHEVWLLLDGADEMASELGQPLSWVAQQLRQPGWVAQARVVLTSRLNVWSADGDRLVEFDTYRNLDFEPEQVDEFIEKWFAEEPNSSQKLKEELERSSDRIKSLIRNPLRLTLLCITWKGVGDRLPETKAGLYQRLVNAHYKWKDDKQEFVIDPDEREQLHQQLGELSKAALDSKESRFRLRQSFIARFLGKPNKNNSLFWWAIKLGWLNQIGLPGADENDADESVYAFFHPTFQEYFAALAIDDWNYFLPYEDTDQPIEDLVEEDECYRIFEPQWIEVILLWIGRLDLNKDVKQDFVDNLVSFEDICVGCYNDRAFFLASSVIAEFDECDLADEIIGQLITYAFGNYEDSEWIEAPDFIVETAKIFIQKTSQKYLFNSIGRTYKLKPDTVQLEIAELLIDSYKINPLSTEILENISVQSRDNHICLRASTKLLDSSIDNAIAIKVLESLINFCRDDSIRVEAATELLSNDAQNSIAIRTLIELAVEKYDVLAIEGLSYAHGNTVAIEVLEQIIKELEPIVKESEDEDEEPECLSAYWTAEDSLYRISSQQAPSSRSITATELSVYEPDEDYINDRILEDLEELEIYVSDILEANKGKIIEDENLFKELLEIYLENYSSNENTILTEEKSQTEIEILEIEQSILCDIEESLGGKNSIIAKVLELIYSTEDDEYFYDALSKLEKIGKNDVNALNGVINIAIKGTRSHRLNMVIYAIAYIGGINNLTAIDFLLRTIITPQKKEVEWIVKCAVDSLKEILQGCDLMIAVVAFLAKYIINQGSVTKSEMFLNCYSVLWHCSQYLSYPDFFAAWHNSSSANTELPTDD